MYKVALPLPPSPVTLVLPLVLPVMVALLLLMPPFLYAAAASSLAAHELSFLVLSQPAKFNAARARSLRYSIVEQLKELTQPDAGGPNEPDNVFLSHELFPDNDGAWAITPVLRHVRTSLLKATHRTARWLIICEEQSHVNVSLLAHHLAKEDYREKLFLGYPLHDREATIIHHFAFFKNPSSFLYPYVRAGVALTVPLVDHLVELIPLVPLSDFFIDAAHEFALLLWRQGTGYPLQPRRYFCAKPAPGCAIQALFQGAAVPGAPARGAASGEMTVSCGRKPTSIEHIMFAVKTCHKYHRDRIPVLKHTWTRFVEHLRYFSDASDHTIPTVVTSVPNTGAGHCAKTLAILRLIRDEIRFNATLQATVRWVMLVDDDTILSPSSLVRFLSCYDPDRDLYLGERYGYHLMSTDGYNYVTGGGGIVLSVAILDALQQTCECPAPSSPDDMILAACLQRLGVRPIHSSLFHQARPSDYAPELLDPLRTVSFHKHWQVDPHQVYNRWFRQSDEQYHFTTVVSGSPSGPSLPSDGAGKLQPRVADDAGERVSHRCATYQQPAVAHMVSNRNENDSIRELRQRVDDDKASTVHRPGHDNDDDDVHLRPSHHRRTSRTAPPVTDASQHNHILRTRWCESNELQSNSDHLLLHQKNLPETANIIKHSDL
ncbi:beta-1,3-glucosyltransferase [Anopheles darlingi]|uniref:beta-1,3-glucosyltransferase n=1 Tax=Anopheles darlingi TaxID=43151 RepID=UPI002100497F|nr:beta-1,3-glucosyltransferase [Anopheles darlingi]